MEQTSTLALNFSYVLHEPSWSQAVLDAVASQRRSPAGNDNRRKSHRIVGAHTLFTLDPQIVLTARIGEPQILLETASRLPTPPAIVTADGGAGGQIESYEFFRAPATLVLPIAEVERLCVAAVISRPGGNEWEMVSRGPFVWPEMRGEAIAALEGLIRDHLDQWRPDRALWPAPAEVLLPEVVTMLSNAADTG